MHRSFSMNDKTVTHGYLWNTTMRGKWTSQQHLDSSCRRATHWVSSYIKLAMHQFTYSIYLKRQTRLWLFPLHSLQPTIKLVEEKKHLKNIYFSPHRELERFSAFSRQQVNERLTPGSKKSLSFGISVITHLWIGPMNWMGFRGSTDTMINVKGIFHPKMKILSFTYPSNVIWY